MPEAQTSVPPHVQVIQMGTACLGLAARLHGRQPAPRGSFVEQSKVRGRTGGDPGNQSARPSPIHANARELRHPDADQDETFALTPLGDALKSDAPGAARSTILTMAGPWMWKAFGEFQYSGETGKTAMEKVFGMPIFD